MAVPPAVPATPAPSPTLPALASSLAVADTLEQEPTPAPPVATPPLLTPTPLVVPTPGPPRVGLQVGHWRAEELPDELSRLRTATGGAGGGVREVEINLLVTERVAARLRELGYVVDILPATVPPSYQADLFLAIHADASTSSGPHGFKLARSRWSRLLATDDALVATLRDEYAQATGLPWDDAITRNMTGYYAFNNRRRQFAIHKTTPAAILEMGYLTNPGDRALLTGQTNRVVEGITRGIVRFIDERPPLAEREQPATSGFVITISEGGATARSGPSLTAPAIAELEAGRRQEAPEMLGDWFGIWITERNGPGWVHRSQATVSEVALP
jgi:N-acetylmuramoyl-L-alanine amidase